MPVGDHPEARQAAEDERLRARGRCILEERGRVLDVARGDLCLPSNPRKLPEQDDRLRRSLAVTDREERLARLGQNLSSGRLSVEPCPSVAEQQLRPFGIRFGPELERGAVEANGGSEGVQSHGAIPGLAERDPGRLRERVDLLAGGPRELERAQIMVGEHLRSVLGSLDVERLDPGSGEAMLLRPPPPRDLAVGDVANEDVPEGVLRLAVDRGAAVAPDEPLALEREQPLLDPPARQASEGHEGACPERPADDRSVLEERLLGRWQGVESGRDDGLDRLRQRELCCGLTASGGPDEPPVHEHAQVLARVQGGCRRRATAGRTERAAEGHSPRADSE